MKTIIAIVLTIILITGIPACMGLGPNPCGHVDPFFRVIGLGNTQMLVSSSGGDIVIPPAGTGTFAGHFFSTNMRVSFYSAKQPATPGLFMNTAYATSCVDAGNMGSKEGIDSIFFITNVNIDSTIMANDTINDFITMSSSNTSFLPVSNFLADNKGGFTIRDFQWKLMRMPDNLAIAYTFKVIIKLSNGEEVSTITTPYFFN